MLTKEILTHRDKFQKRQNVSDIIFSRVRSNKERLLSANPRQSKNTSYPDPNNSLKLMMREPSILMLPQVELKSLTISHLPSLLQNNRQFLITKRCLITPCQWLRQPKKKYCYHSSMTSSLNSDHLWSNNQYMKIHSQSLIIQNIKMVKCFINLTKGNIHSNSQKLTHIVNRYKLSTIRWSRHHLMESVQ